jgi:hypothetical protein
LTNTVVYSDCTLGERGDTIVASWTANISGATGRDTAGLTGATLTVVGARTVTQSLSVEPVSAELTDGQGSVDQRKTGASTDPGWVCVEVCQPAATWSLEVEFDAGSAFASGDFYCPS